MVREFRQGNFGVYVGRERGQPHHLPHAHIKLRGRRVASVFLLTLQIYDCRVRLPRVLLGEIAKQQTNLLERWQELNPDE